MDFCPKCGFSLKADPAYPDASSFVFCPKCGTRLDAFGEPDIPPQNMEAQVLELLQRKQYIEAIKLVREQTNQGLKECRGVVDTIAMQNSIPLKNLDATPKSRFLIFLILSAFLGLIIASAGIALFPQLGYVAKPFLCDGELIVKGQELHTSRGEAGNITSASQSFHCANGGSDRTIHVFIVSSLVYTAIFMALLYMRRLFRIIRRSGGPDLQYPTNP